MRITHAPKCLWRKSIVVICNACKLHLFTSFIQCVLAHFAWATANILRLAMYQLIILKTEACFCLCRCSRCFLSRKKTKEIAFAIRNNLLVYNWQRLCLSQREWIFFIWSTVQQKKKKIEIPTLNIVMHLQTFMHIIISSFIIVFISLFFAEWKIHVLIAVNYIPIIQIEDWTDAHTHSLSNPNE